MWPYCQRFHFVFEEAKKCLQDVSWRLAVAEVHSSFFMGIHVEDGLFSAGSTN